jgi:hypothetical protein
MKFLLPFSLYIQLAHAAPTHYECVGKKYNFSLILESNSGLYTGSLITKSHQVWLQSMMNEVRLNQRDRKQFSGNNGTEGFDFYFFDKKSAKGTYPASLNIVHKFGPMSTYLLDCITNKSDK